MDPQPLIGDFYVNTTRNAEIFIAVYVSTVGFVATIGNICVLFILLRFNTFRKKSINYLLVNIAASDLGVSFSGYPMTSSSAFAGYWLFGDGGCHYYAFCVYTCSCSAIGSHVAVAVYRYIYVCKPAHKHKLTAKLTFTVIASIWAFALFWTVSPLLGWSRYTYEPFRFSCSLDWTGRSLAHITYNSACVFGVFVLPLIVMIYCYYEVGKRSNQINPDRRDERDKGMAVFLQIQKKEKKIDVHVTKMCFLSTMSFVIAWTPYTILCIWVVSINSDVQLSLAASLLPTLFAKSSCAMNPLVYFLSSSRYRRDFFKIFRRPRRAREFNGTDPYRQTERDANAGGPSNRADDNPLYLRRTVSPTGDISASVYFNKERIYIGDIKPAGISQEATLMQKDAEVLSLTSSNSSVFQVVVKEPKKKFEMTTVQIEI
ncbi:rhodopsin, G0-coupled-like [Asterias rubens]|uniref:rhodopsin, G0-coupled-like n=1 Tax=Asterias rubens TaxID=7604 RepID=UPI001454F353|nr:rhodopsin, G0-coupled-like [Asterias rubens]